jgi:hypothetical protein
VVTPKTAGRRRVIVARSPRSASARRDGGSPSGKVPIPRTDPAFFLDLDGTLLEIADRPHEVRIDAQRTRFVESTSGSRPR